MIPPGFALGPGFARSFSPPVVGTGVPAPDPGCSPVPPLLSLLIEKTPEPGAVAVFDLFPGQPRLLTGATAPGAGEEAKGGGEDGGKGEDAGFSDVLGRCVGGSVEAAIANARGGSFRRIIRDICDFELRRESVGEEGSGSILHRMKRQNNSMKINLKKRCTPKRNFPLKDTRT